MKRYPAYKDSGVEWIGEIPEHWGNSKIKYNTYVKGRIGWQGLTTSEYIDEGPFLVTGTDFQQGVVDWNTCQHVSEDRYDQDEYIQLQENDLLITKDGTIGKIALAKDFHGKATLNSGVFVTRPRNGTYTNDFMFWILNSKVFDEYIEFIKTGTTISHLYQNTFVEFAYPLPGTAEQKQIANYLHHKTHLIGTLIEKKQKQIELLQEQRAAIINQAVTKGLNSSVKMKDSGIEWLGEVPEHWNILKLKHLLRVKDGTHATPPYIVPSELAYPLVTSKDIKNGNIDFSEAKFISEEDHFEVNKRSDVQEGDVIMPMIGTIGNPAIVKTARKFSIKNVALFKSSNSPVGPRYICFFLLSDCVAKQFNLLSRGGVQGFVSLDILRNLVAFKLSQNEQKQTVKHLDLVTTKINNNINAINTIIERLSEYRTTLISNVVTGKIDVRDEVIP